MLPTEDELRVELERDRALLEGAQEGQKDMDQGADARRPRKPHARFQTHCERRQEVAGNNLRLRQPEGGVLALGVADEKHAKGAARPYGVEEMV